jgi:hypothetical protein
MIVRILRAWLSVPGSTDWIGKMRLIRGGFFEKPMIFASTNHPPAP